MGQSNGMAVDTRLLFWQDRPAAAKIGKNGWENL
jgi:hypothetical protein